MKMSTVSSQTKTMNRSLVEQSVDRLFVNFSIIYGKRWIGNLKDPNWEKMLRKGWANILKNVSKEDILMVIRFLGSDKNTKYITFPPNPLEVLKMSKELKHPDLPSMEECFIAAGKRNWALHPIVYHTASKCNLWWFRRASEYLARKRFSEQYEYAKKDLFRGELLIKPHCLLTIQKTECKDLL